MIESGVIVGTPICRRTSYILDKFLSNQQEIQQAYPRCSLVLATDELEFATELETQIHLYQLKGEVITYKTITPDHCHSRLWSICGGREAIRRYVLSRETNYLLFVDSDILTESLVVRTMLDKIQDYDVVLCGLRFPPKDDLRFGTGLSMIRRKILEKISFRCYEFSQSEVMVEDDLFDLDSFRYHARVNRGIYLSVRHYGIHQEYSITEPQRLSWFRSITNWPFVRYMLVGTSVLLKHNIPGKLHSLLYRARSSTVKFES